MISKKHIYMCTGKVYITDQNNIVMKVYLYNDCLLVTLSYYSYIN